MAVWLIHVIFYVIRFALSVCIDEDIGVGSLRGSLPHSIFYPVKTQQLMLYLRLWSGGDCWSVV